MIAGVDYSMTSPAICLSPLSEFKYETCIFSYLTTLKKYDIAAENIFGKYFEYDNEIKRYDTISSHFLNMLLDYNVRTCYIEGYSMGSKGRTFNISENTGIFKHRMWNFGINFIAIPPATIKKFATGKGNANKEKMQRAFIEETSKDIKQILNMTENQWNPSSDIIDSYYVCKYGFHQETLKNE
ncbi:hypothetical protein EB118_16650 [bacterium]|nr:hypothetical protein [bacterium]NDG31685.1 hypothetical protein [bacterium]